MFYHFDTKDALLVEALEYAVERDADRLDKALAKEGEPLERLRRVLTSYGPTGAAHGWTLWIEAWSTALREPSIQASLRKLDKRWRGALEHVITDGVASGDFTCDDPKSTVARVGALLDGLSVAALIYKSVNRRQLQTVGAGHHGGRAGHLSPAAVPDQRPGQAPTRRVRRRGDPQSHW